MQNLTRFFVILSFSMFSIFVFGQKGNSNSFVASYLVSYKNKVGMTEPLKEFSRLIVKGEKSFFQSSNEMRRDSLMIHDKGNQEQLSYYYSNLKFSIEISGTSSLYNETLIKNEYEYNEKLNFDWKIDFNKEKIISGYTCLYATTDYGGRSWLVWFTKEIPINAGPYKFKGLPGLILEAEDTSGSYKFSFNRFLKSDVAENTKLSRYYHSESLTDRNIINQNEFNKLNVRLKKMSSKERLAYIMTDENGISKGEMVEYEVGGEPNAQIRELEKNVQLKYNPIEFPIAK